MLKLEKYTRENLEDLFKTGVYKITCLSNNKIYIGSASSIKSHSRTHKGFYGRWRLHLRLLEANKHTNKHLQNAWNLYGDENFTFEILEKTSPEEAENREIYLSQILNAYDSDFGFNILKGNLSYKSNRDINTRTKISNSLIGKLRPKNMNKHLEIPVLQYDLNGSLIAEYNSISEAERNTPCMRQAIYKCCVGVYKTSNGFKWKYKNPIKQDIKESTYRKQIYKFDLQMNFLCRYDSLIKCSKDLNYSRSTVRSYLNSEIPIDNNFYLKTNMSGARG